MSFSGEEDGKDNSSDKTGQGETAGTETVRSRAESLVDSKEGMEETGSKHESDDGKTLLHIEGVDSSLVVFKECDLQ